MTLAHGQRAISIFIGMRAEVASKTAVIQAFQGHPGHEPQSARAKVSQHHYSVAHESNLTLCGSFDICAGGDWTDLFNRHQIHLHIIAKYPAAGRLCAGPGYPESASAPNQDC